MYLRKYVYVCMYVHCIQTSWLYACMHVCMYVRMYVCVCACVCMYACMYVLSLLLLFACLWCTIDNALAYIKAG